MAADAPTFRMASNSTPLGSNPVLALGAGIVLGGFVEEQLYRGYVLVRLTERRSLPMAIAPILVFFGLLHFGLGWTGMLVVTMMGFTLTLLFIWRRHWSPWWSPTLSSTRSYSLCSQNRC